MSDYIFDRAMGDAAMAAIPQSEELRCKANGIKFAYDRFGAADAPPLILLQGLGCQIIAAHARHYV